jgi:hypothetical protein
MTWTASPVSPDQLSTSSLLALLFSSKLTYWLACWLACWLAGSPKSKFLLSAAQLQRLDPARPNG